MAHVLFWSSIICCACIVLTTFARCRKIVPTPKESVMGEIGPMSIQKVRERIARDGSVKMRVRVDRASSSGGKSEVDDVLPKYEPNRAASESMPVTDSSTATAANILADTSVAVASADGTSADVTSADAASVAASTETAASAPVSATVSDAAAAADAAARQSSVSLSSTAPNALYSNGRLDYQGCSMNPCKNAGVCKLQPFGANKIFCRCLPGFFGEFCQYDAPECQMDPCLHSGDCRRSMTEPRGYECHCSDGYEGDNCETMVTTYAAAVPPVGVTYVSDLSVESAVSSPPMPTTTTTTTSFFLQMPFLAMVAVSLLMLALSLFATIDAERKIVIERYAVLTAHGYVLEYPKAGYLRLAIRKFLFLSCLCFSVFPCLDTYFVQQAEEQVPLPVLLKTGQHKGYTPLPQTGDRGSRPASAAFSQTPSVAGR